MLFRIRVSDFYISLILYDAGWFVSTVDRCAVKKAPRSIHGKLQFQIGFPVFVQTLAVGEGLSRVAPSIGLLSFVFMVFCFG